MPDVLRATQGRSAAWMRHGRVRGSYWNGERVVRRSRQTRTCGRPPFVVRRYGVGTPPGRGRRPVEWDAAGSGSWIRPPCRVEARVAAGGLDPRRLRHALKIL